LGGERVEIKEQELSKHKYLYRIYASDDKIIHCEKHPVIYLNSKVVYFKDIRQAERLKSITFNRIEDEYSGIRKSDINTYVSYERYFWKAGNFNSKEATEEAFSIKKASELEQVESDFKRAEKEYLYAKEKYEKLL